MSATTFLRVNIFHPISNTSTATNFVPYSSLQLDDVTLDELRQALIGNKGLEPSRAGCLFCTPDGIQVPDNITFSTYNELSVRNEEQSNDDPPKKQDRNRNIWRDIYIKDYETEHSSDHSHLIKELLNDLNLKQFKENPGLLLSTLKAIAKVPGNFKGEISPSENSVIVANMSERDWETVLHQSSFLNGYQIMSECQGIVSNLRVERASHPAFSIKARPFRPSNIRNISNESLPKFTVPRFVVTDNAYIDAFETQGDLSTSMTRNAFSRDEIEASIGGGAFGNAANLSSSVTTSKTNAFTKSTSQSNKVINITYNLPRVKLFLGSDDLELTQECKDELEVIKTAKRCKKPQALVNFQRKFGHIFATQVELGGRLHSAEDVSAFGTQDTATATRAFKAAAKASLNASFAQASVGFSHESEFSTAEISKANQYQQSVAWQAQGGNSLLCNNPGEWSPTVAPFQNWRVITQRGLLRLPEIISEFGSHQEIANSFKEIAENSRTTQRIPLKLKATNANFKDKFLTLAKFEQLADFPVTRPSRFSRNRRAEYSLGGDGTINHHEHEPWSEALQMSDRLGCICDCGVSNVIVAEAETTLNELPQILFGEHYRMRSGRHGPYFSLLSSRRDTYLYAENNEPSTQFMFKKADNESQVNTAVVEAFGPSGYVDEVSQGEVMESKGFLAAAVDQEVKVIKAEYPLAGYEILVFQIEKI